MPLRGVVPAAPKPPLRIPTALAPSETPRVELVTAGPAGPEGGTSSQDETREVKVKLPVDQILRLHYTRMKKRENFSQIVSTALSRYFEELTST
ncbi:MAG: hypothetical protein ACYC2H_12385 [Thermoplasmatota archaeon]